MDLLSLLAFLSIHNPFCNYFLDEVEVYNCDVENFYNPIGYDGFFLIDGQHMIYRSDSDVQTVTFKSQRTQNVPHVICEKFQNLQTFTATSMGIEIIDMTAFQNCINLQIINLFANPILTLHADTFSRNLNLREVFFGYTRLTSLPENLLKENRQLEHFTAAQNYALVDIPAGFFLSCQETLKLVYMDANKLSVWHAEWFANATALTLLVAMDNVFTKIPDNAINGQSLYYLDLDRNFLTDLSSSSFDSVTELIHFYISYNDFTGIDRQLFEQAQNVYFVGAERSNCIDYFFQDFNANRITNMDLLSNCFDGFEVTGEFTTVGSESRFFPFRGVGTIVEVKVASHAVIMLSETQSANNPYIEIRIDENNVENYISRILVDGVTVGEVHIAKYLNADDFTTFIIQWNFSLISVERSLAGNFDGPFLTYAGAIDFNKIKFFGVKTGGENVATWRISDATA